MISVFVSSYHISKIIWQKKTGGAVPTKIVKFVNKETCNYLANCINESIKMKEFSNKLKTADTKPTFNIEDLLNKEN